MIRYVLILTLLISCKNSSNENAISTIDTGQQINRSAVAKIDKLFPELIQYFKSNDSTYHSELFEPSVPGQLDTSMKWYATEQKDIQPFYSYFIFNPDSSYAIDMYSYNILLYTKNGKTIAEATGPDVEVSLIDWTKKLKKRILFGGPGLSILDAAWLDKNQFYIIGGQVIDNNSFKPLMYKVNNAANTIQTFYYEDTLRLNPEEFKDPRIKIE